MYNTRVFYSISFILVLIAFVFLLLATISTPIVKTFELAKTTKYSYGVFGYCSDGTTNCSSATYPLTLSTIDENINWLFASNTRDTLAKIFILTPISLGFNFITMILSMVCNFVSDGESRSMVLTTVVVNILAVILTIVSAIITVLTFHPFLTWTGWILIGAAVASLISLIMLVFALTQLSSMDEEFHQLALDVGRSSAEKERFDKLFGGNPPINATYNTTTNSDNDYDYKPFKVSSTSSNGFAASGATAVTAASAISLGKQQNNRYQSYNNNYNNYSGHAKAGSFSSSALTTPHLNKSNGSFGYVPPTATATQQDPTPYPTQSPQVYNDTSSYHQSVFEHHPEVEGHKPFTELDDDFDDEELPRNNGGHTPVSDTESDFTSVSQRAPNYNYNQQYQQQPQQQQQFQPEHETPQLQPQRFGGYNSNSRQGYYPSSVPNVSPTNGYIPQPQPQQVQQPQQPARTTISESVLNNNPDFSVDRLPGKRRVAPGFVPVAARYGGQKNSGNPYSIR